MFLVAVDSTLYHHNTAICCCRDPSLYWGTWYSISTCTNCTDPDATVCSQVSFVPDDASSKTSNLTYTASFQNNEPQGPTTQVFGLMRPIDLEGFNPLYSLDLAISNSIF